MASTEPRAALGDGVEDSGNEGPLQFGRRRPGVDYADRPCAYGVLPRADGKIALVHIRREDGEYDDLPGGALDPGEDDAAALAREFGEETGLGVVACRLLVRCGQYMRKVEGEYVDNRSGLYVAELIGEDYALKIEYDHALQWVDPFEALVRLRHDSHALAVMLFLRETV